MAGRRYRVLRAAGQDVPACNAQTLEFLQWGDCLIAWHAPFPIEQAGAAWEAHRHQVLESWRTYWDKHDILPTCWAARVFDNVPQIAMAGLDTWARDRIAGIEADVAGYLRRNRRAA